ncbi:sulfoxide reductase heme-binding subunit YedZ [Alsobacter sp. SYSU M60028]|uniref:Protein-methionine-sulfoxide reductase heme-binding subunit MsrQ n=1 Tax=Alsobacter ponti TaxID=2962936 RepID=A0ABT1LGK3_9HYPH|nr:protein-methionine-sulfoxide reductase heme-binding subunit MsrQ [Alsobacter ponti]MCP8940579.1 sulfoxide reductase heme-binding subunit YedZ [Alsobacter ponti]
MRSARAADGRFAWATSDPVRALKPLVFLLCLAPALLLVHDVLYDPEALGANPAETIEHVTGDRSMQFLLGTLAITPLRRITGWGKLIRFRRMLGLFAFFYGVLHLAAYIAFDHYFDVPAILADIVKRPFVTVGFAALVLMTPLAVTSTAGWIRRLGAQNWSRLHKAVYAIAVLGVLHYWWLVKRDLTWPMIYGAILAVLLGWRVWNETLGRQRRRPARVRARAEPGPAE